MVMLVLIQLEEYLGVHQLVFKMKKQIILLIFGMIFLFSILFINATDSDYIFKQGSQMDIKRPCFNNGTYCSSSAICNTTIIYPNSTILINNKQMQNQIAFHNYTLNSSLVSNGEYETTITCIDGSQSGSETFFFEVNPTGIRSTDQRQTATSRALYVIFGLAIIFFVGFLTFSNPPVKYSFMIVSIIFGVASINLAFQTLRYEVVSNELLDVFDFLSAASFYFYWFAGGLLIIIWILTFFNTMNESFSKQKYDKFGANF